MPWSGTGSRVMRVTGQLTDGSQVKKCDPLSALRLILTITIQGTTVKYEAYRSSTNTQSTDKYLNDKAFCILHGTAHTLIRVTSGNSRNAV